MTKKKTGADAFVAVQFDVDEYPGCCGIGVLQYFRDAEDRYEYDWVSRKNVLKKAVKHFKTREEVAEDVYKRMASPDHGYPTLTCTLITKYAKPTKEHLEDLWSDEEREDAKARAGKGQFPELEAILKREKWKRLTFLNPNHGNTLTMYTKHFPEWANR